MQHKEDRKRSIKSAYNYTKCLANRNVLGACWNKNLSQDSAVKSHPPVFISSWSSKSQVLDQATCNLEAHHLDMDQHCWSLMTNNTRQVESLEVLSIGIYVYPSSSDSKSRVALSVSISHSTSPAATCHTILWVSVPYVTRIKPSAET